MKIGILLAIIGILIIIAWLHTYIYGGDWLSASLVMFLFGIPSLYFGIRRIKRYKIKNKKAKGIRA